MESVFAGDYGFSLDFVSMVDLSAMTNVRLLIRKPSGTVATYDFTAQEFGGVTAGGTLSYQVQAGDLDKAGDYFFQVVAKDGVGDIAFTPFQLNVKPRLLANSWA